MDQQATGRERTGPGVTIDSGRLNGSQGVTTFLKVTARTYANGEVYHYLRDKGFLIKVPSSWRELHARGLKLMRLGVEATGVPGRLGVSGERWKEIVDACGQRVVAFEVGED